MLYTISIIFYTYHSISMHIYTVYIIHHIYYTIIVLPVSSTNFIITLFSLIRNILGSKNCPSDLRARTSAASL